MTQRLLVVGAHPDDADIRAGGLACAAAAAGHDVKFVSATDGRAGHHVAHGDALAERRREEAAAAAAVAGIEYEVLENPDGRLEPTLENREDLIETIRRYEPSVVLSHRPNDYHPDHRATARLVRDAAYMVLVPAICPHVDPLEENPVFGHLSDTFETPTPFDPDVFVPVEGETLERKYDMLARHESQFYEWLPSVAGVLESVPSDPDARRAWLETAPIGPLEEMRTAADRYREELLEAFGDRGRTLSYVEPFEITAYGGELTADVAADLFTG